MPEIAGTKGERRPMNFLLNGMSRRHFVKHMAGASMTLPMANWINTVHAARAAGKAKKNHSMILLWMSGGPATIDIWDLKPGSKNGGEFKPIQTTGAGEICEHLPNMAKVMKHLNIIRSYNSRDGAHDRGTYINHAAFPPLPTITHPAIGAVVSKFNTPSEFEIPGHISLGGPGVSPGFLGMSYAPFRVSAGANPIPNLNPTISMDRAKVRTEALLKAQDSFIKERRGNLPGDHNTIVGKALDLMSSKLLEAFKVENEDAATKERYGTTQFGQNCLMARRLVEIGVPFVEVGLGGWDMHAGIWNALAGTGRMGGGGMMGAVPALPTVDMGFSSLVQDLVDRGLWETTTIVWMGDFGRTPRINQDGGRDHWPNPWSVVLGGGTMKGGNVIGATDADGVMVKDRPIEVSNLFATLYKATGIDPNTVLRSPEGRPIKLTGIFGDGKEIPELF
jgi:hypothetical protein